MENWVLAVGSCSYFCYCIIGSKRWNRIDGLEGIRHKLELLGWGLRGLGLRLKDGFGGRIFVCLLLTCELRQFLL